MNNSKESMTITITEDMCTGEPHPRFDADLSRNHPTNREAAQKRGLRWSDVRRLYVDADGCAVRDRFGQPL
jgi:hypothetical protein